MEICITKHAIKRYRERLFDYDSSDKVIRNLLREIASQGKQICLRPNTWDNCFEIKYKGIFIVLLVNDDKAVVLTVLGDRRYRKWIKRNDLNMRISQGIRYPV